MEKYDDILVNHTRVFSVQLKQSLSADEVLEEVTPDAQYFYEDMKKLYEDMMRDYREGVFNGASAYEIAAANGFEGTEEEWLESLHGKDGKDYEHSEEFSSLAQQIRDDKESVDGSIRQFDTDYVSKVNDFNSNASKSTSAYNENASEKLNEYNSNHQSMMDVFNTNANEKISEYDSNVNEKTAVFDKNANDKLNAYNLNAESKTDTFNQNVTAKTNEFNQAVTNARQDAKANVLTDNVNASENHYLDDSYDTTFCNLEIRGKSTQVQETGIVPTPSRPVPLISKKVTVGNQVVELRSLKETGNMWDLKFVKKNSNAGAKVYIDGNDIRFSGWAINAFPNLIGLLKPNTTYSIMATIEMVEKIENENLTQASGNVGILLYRNSVEGLENVSVWLVDKQTNADLGQGQELTVKKTFTAPSDLTSCSILFYSERYLDDSNNAYYSTVKFKDIVLVEGSAQPTGYIVPTVRDYLIVDDTNQTITVERNVGYKQFNGSESWMTYADDSNENYKYGYSIIVDDMRPTSNRENGFANNIEAVTYARAKHLECWLGVNNNYIYVVSLDDNFNTVDKWKTHLIDKNMIAQYPLETPTEETIPYVSGINNTVGLTTQDSTSPSPTIPSPIESVDTVDIKVCGKNLFDGNVTSGTINGNNGQYTAYSTRKVSDFIKVIPNQPYIFSDKNNKWVGIFAYDKDKNYLSFISSNNGSCTYSNSKYLSNVNYLKISFEYVGNEDNNSYQLEIGTQATSHEPYKEQALSLELPFSFKGSLDGSIFDYIDVERGKYVQCLKEEVFDGSSDENWSFLHTTDYDICFVNYSNIAAKNGSAICNRYINYSYITGYSHGITVNVNGCICVSDGLHTGNVNDFKALLQEYPITVIYQLGTPIEYEIPQETLEQLKSLHSYTNVTNITSNAPMSFEYVQHLQTVFNRLLQQINTLESEALSNV